MKTAKELLLILEELVDGMSSHSMACVQTDKIRDDLHWLERDGKSVVTEESCLCSKPYKEALKALNRFDEPVVLGQIKANERICKFGRSEVSSHQL